MSRNVGELMDDGYLLLVINRFDVAIAKIPINSDQYMKILTFPKCNGSCSTPSRQEPGRVFEFHPKIASQQDRLLAAIKMDHDLVNLPADLRELAEQLLLEHCSVRIEWRADQRRG